jgi:hypothetical protein
MLPSAASAYMTAEDVLLSSDFYLPPSKREAEGRIARQATVSAERRKREQTEIFVHAAAPEEIPMDEEWTETDEDVSGETDTKALSSTDLELLRTMRLLDRITDRQRVLQYGAPQEGHVLHGGASNLAPTGAGAWVAATTMIGAVVWTLRRAKRSERQIL